jgi:NAD(P)-dependent dehydrogenase (short-subunit alcohol dehydrogenase family)
MTDANNKLVLITGATSGIGKAAAQAIASQVGKVVLVGRNPQKTAATVAEIKQASGNAAVESLLADLSSMADVRRLAAEITQRYDRLDVLVNNAGGFFMRRQETVDGLEMTFGLNHVSYFLLTTLLLDQLKASASGRIVNVASGAESGARPNWDDLQMTRSYRSFQAYACSKRFNLYFTYELARRLDGTGVTANALHPGAVATSLWSRPAGGLARLVDPLTRLAMRSPEQGAETLVYLATSPEVEGVTGKYFVDRKQKTSSRASQDPDAARRLWQISETLAGVG